MVLKYNATKREFKEDGGSLTIRPGVPGQTDITVEGWSGGGGGGGGSVDPADLISTDADNATTLGSDGKLFTPKGTGWFRMEIRADGHLWLITVDGGTNPLHIDNDGHLILTI